MLPALLQKTNTTCFVFDMTHSSLFEMIPPPINFLPTIIPYFFSSCVWSPPSAVRPGSRG